MDLDQARTLIVTWAKEEFGRLVEVRDVAVVRRASGRTWSGELYCNLQEGEVHIGATEIDDHGAIVQIITPDQLLDGLVKMRQAQSDSQGDPFGGDSDFSDLGGDDDFSDLSGNDDFADIGGDDRDSVFGQVDSSVIQEMADTLIASGERDKLEEARELLPQLLSNHESRGNVLQQMGELELLLGELELGVNYLEAAARNFADVAHLHALEQVAQLTMKVIGVDRYAKSPIKSLLDSVRSRLRPMENLRAAPLFVGLSDEEIAALELIAAVVAPVDGHVIMNEGDPASFAFVIQEGVVSIRIQTPDGGNKIVRSCYPGEFIGENSVIGVRGATCTATVRAEGEPKLWAFDGAQLRELGNKYPNLILRVESAKTLHQLDSFISTHDATETLHVAMRDQILGSISGISRQPAGTVLNAAGAVPRVVHLIAEGTVEYKIKGAVARTYKVDAFAGLRDTLHELPLEGDFVAATDCLLVEFDTESLKELAADATPAVIAVLEKME